jgi:nucleotide-binding universal stress UspA family protein
MEGSMKTKILVASDGKPQSIGALRMAAELAEVHRADVELIAVVEPFPVYGTGTTDVVAITWHEVQHAGEQALLQAVLDQLAEVGPGASGWTVTVEVGLPARTIVQKAERIDASLIVVGLGSHDLADRCFGTEMALRVMRLSHVPVLAVPAHVSALPRKALLAMDFTELGADAARAAALLLAPAGELHLVHVVADAVPALPRSDGQEWFQQYQEALVRVLVDFGGTLDRGPACRLEAHVLQGDPARQILRLAEKLGAELIAAGSHGSGFLGRMLMGSVSSRLVRNATCPVLIAPPPSLPVEPNPARDEPGVAVDEGGTERREYMTGTWNLNREAIMKGRILAASDGRAASNGALRVARLLEQRLDTGVEVVTVWAPIPIGGVGTGEFVSPAYLEWEQLGATSQRQQVMNQLADLGLAAAEWPVTLEVGATAPAIVRLATERKAPLIVMGLGQHDLVDRWFGTETALQVMRLAHVPVLAVPSGWDRLPRTAVVAVDFSEFSREAALALMDLLEPGGSAHLVHVLWKPSTETPWVGGMDWIEEHRQHARVQIETVAETLRQNADVAVYTHLPDGDAARQVLRIAEEVDADLIAAGSHGAGFLGRSLMGSVSTRLVRGASCAVLVSPPRSVATEVASAAPAVQGVAAAPELEEAGVK